MTGRRMNGPFKMAWNWWPQSPRGFASGGEARTAHKPHRGKFFALPLQMPPLPTRSHTTFLNRLWLSQAQLPLSPAIDGDSATPQHLPAPIRPAGTAAEHTGPAIAMTSKQAQRRPQRATAGGFGPAKGYTADFMNGNGLGGYSEIGVEQVTSSCALRQRGVRAAFEASQPVLPTHKAIPGPRQAGAGTTTRS
jgi:hypothetical protein